MTPQEPEEKMDAYIDKALSEQDRKMSLTEWIIKGDTGISSKTIWAAMMNVEKKPRRLERAAFESYDVPKDSADFRRCYLLVKNCNLRERLPEVVKVFPAWKPFIDNWDKLVKMLLEGLRMYPFMSKLDDESMEIDGWEYKGAGRWRRPE